MGTKDIWYGVKRPGKQIEIRSAWVNTGLDRMSSTSKVFAKELGCEISDIEDIGEEVAHLLFADRLDLAVLTNSTELKSDKNLCLNIPAGGNDVKVYGPVIVCSSKPHGYVSPGSNKAEFLRRRHIEYINDYGVNDEVEQIDHLFWERSSVTR